MKIVIDIPEEFEEHFKFDRFADSLERIETDIKTLRCKRMSGTYEQETITMIHEAFINSTPFVEESKTDDLIVLKFDALMGRVDMNEDRERVLTQIERDGVVFLPYYMSVAYIGNKCEVKFVDEEEKEVGKNEDTTDAE